MIINADILIWAAAYDGPLFHAVLCDPPYHLTEITNRFGKPDSAPAQYGTDGAFQRASKGFMGRTWDGGMVAFQPETWAAIARLLHPGAFLMAFAGSRGYHRMACAIEDAGFIIHPAIGWAFGSGFPKATRIDTQVDRRAGVERTTVGTRRHQPKFAAKDFGYREKDNGYNSRERESFDVTAPATELAQAWQGHRYGLQALKPAFEFICVAQKPYQGRPVDSITATGAGALNIDGGRIPGQINPNDYDDTRRTQPKFSGILRDGGAATCSRTAIDAPTGRWPANLILSCACDDPTAHLPGCAVRCLGEQSGESESRPVRNGNNTARAMDFHMTGGTTDHNDQGTAARFFFQADWMLDRLEQADSLFYCPKADRSEREAGLDPRQIALMQQMEGETWVNQDRNQAIPAESATPQARATTESGTKGDSSSPMLCDGCKSMGQSPKVTKSTIRTATNKTTESKTSNLLTHSPISDSIADANSDQASGGSHAQCAACSSPLLLNIGISHKKDGRSTENAGPVISTPLSEANGSDAFQVATINDGREKPIDNPYQRGKTERRNLHPCLKPLSLTRYLATLLLPPAEYAPRRLLIPFSGAGSEYIGAMLAGWEEIVGVELEADHCRIAEARIAYWRQRRHELGDPSKPIDAQLSEAPDGQLDMFGGFTDARP